MTDIVERLRERHWRSAAESNDEAKERRQRERNEAADTITRLIAENERLRAALEEIASGKYSGIVLTSYPPQDPAVNRARAALEEKQ